MAKVSPFVERQVRIEMLRARAAIEREAFAQSIADVSHTLEPSNLIRRLLPGNLLRGGGGHGSLLWQAVSTLRRYPFLSSTLSAVFLGKGKGRGLLRVAGGALAGWQLFKAWRHGRRKPAGPADPRIRDDGAF
ncbi:hypothetical protein [Bordetella sp. 2513F-2]